MDIPLSVYAGMMRRSGIHPVVIERVQKLPGAAWGAVMVRPDQPERKALYNFSGGLQASFPLGATDREIRDFLALGRLGIEDDGTVWTEGGHNRNIHLPRMVSALCDAIAQEDARMIADELEAKMSFPTPFPFSIAAE